MAKTSKNTAEAAVQITRGNFFWDNDPDPGIGSEATVTYGFRATRPPLSYDGSDSNERTTFSRFNATQIERTELALTLIADVSNINFERGTTTLVDPLTAQEFTDSATLLFSNYSNRTDGAGAFAFFPGDASHQSSDGDFWYNLEGDTVAGSPTVAIGSYDFLIVLHELGHALGLDHPGEYNAGPNVQIAYGPHAEYREDTWQYTVMSYFEASNTGAEHSIGGRDYYARTMLLHDIEALQRLYGIDTTTRTGNEVYGFNATAGSIYKLDSSAEKAVLCIWDAGGNDTLDLSGYGATQTITLVSEKFSSVGGLTLNWSIAKGATIENAIGGSGVDTIYGNAFANRLSGNAGNDKLFGGGRNDTLNGGAGLDTLDGGSGLGDLVDYSRSTLDTFVELRGATTTTVYAGANWDQFDRADFIRNIELVSTGSGNDVLYGNGLGNVLRAGAGHDFLAGRGGRDILAGGVGSDTFVFGGDKTYSENAVQLTLAEIGVDKIEDFLVGVDQIQLDHDTFTAWATARGPILAGWFNKGVSLVTQQTDDRLFYDTDDGLLYYDKDGSNAGSARVLFAELKSGLLLTFADFEII